jgi:putative hydrolase of the HAD superfamily
VARRFDAVLFDLGNTLAAYYHKEQFRPVLEAAIRNVLAELRRRGLACVDFESALTAALAMNQEATDLRVRPLAGRLVRLFDIGASDDAELIAAVSSKFLEPVFALGRRFDDTMPVLERLRGAGYRLGIVSNSPWGSPPDLWRAELQRLDLVNAVDAAVFCGDVGWRKPAKAIFDHAAQLVGASPDRCCFVGDDPTWDFDGAGAAGMWPILLDRDRRYPAHTGARSGDLWEALKLIEAGVA